MGFPDMDAVGQLSTDGSYCWDGQQRVTTLSADGNWRWDGKSWNSVTPSATLSDSPSFVGQIPG